MASPTKKDASKQSGLPGCPFSGSPVEFKIVGPDAHCMIVGNGWTSKLFTTKAQALNWFCTRNGVTPPWATAKVAVSERVEKEPEDPALAKLRKSLDEAGDIK